MKYYKGIVPFKTIEKYRYLYYTIVSIVGGVGTWLLNRWTNGEPIVFDYSVFFLCWMWFIGSFLLYYVAEKDYKRHIEQQL